MNNNNFGIYTGRITREPVYFQNQNHSFSVVLDVACQQNFASGKEHEYKSDFIEFRGFISASMKNKGIYGYLGTGDKVSIQYSLRSGSREKGGKIEYFQHPFIESIQIMEGRTIREQRRSAKSEA